jgi:hypothetical protein
MLVVALTLVLSVAGTALASHCYVADKPLGVGTGVEGTNGAFESEDGVDVFRNTLPEPAHDNGSSIHGVLEIEEG